MSLLAAAILAGLVAVVLLVLLVLVARELRWAQARLIRQSDDARERERGHRLELRELADDLADERLRTMDALREQAKQAATFADRLSELRREGYTAGGAPRPAPPPDWDPRVIDFLARLNDPAETEIWVAQEVNRHVQKRGEPDWDAIARELTESTVEMRGIHG